MAVEKEVAIHMGQDQGWELLAEDDKQKLVRLVRDNTRIDIWYSRMTVGILKRGQKPVFHRHVTEEKLDEILDKN